ncbi:MAG: hypothetical protein DRJ01_13745 [Bacteroidetes bacterium]|nr:MAG: hypothetical protein DRJ01_13745 [Bacteroidota bacterium]
MRCFYFIPILLIFLIPIKIKAQKEASVWPVRCGKQFDFQSNSLNISDFIADGNRYSTICDKNGNLLLFSDGRTVWNVRNEVLINGEELIGSSNTFYSLPTFVPYPEKEGRYFLFYDESTKSNLSEGRTLYYAEIDINASEGVGEIVKKGNKLVENYHSKPSIAGFCNNNYFWLVINKNENDVAGIGKDQLYFFRIDKNGVSLNPQINSHFDIEKSSGYRFSPNGDRLYFSYIDIENGETWNVIADFNFLKGELYNYREFNFNPESDVNTSDIREFSSNGRLFYYYSDSTFFQIDVTYSDIDKIKESIVPIHKFDTSDEKKFYLQLAPDGKLYFRYLDSDDHVKKIGRINYPNIIGLDCEIEFDIYKDDCGGWSYQELPPFVTSFSRDNSLDILDEIVPDAGGAKIFCSGTTGVLGVEAQPESSYYWISEYGVDDVFSAKTTFNAPVILNRSDTVAYVLRATDANCWVNFDTAFVTVLPLIDTLLIDGSKSVCPFVKEVVYWVANNEFKYEIEWIVKGKLSYTALPFSDSIKVDWGESNNSASVSAFVSSYGCESEITVFPVTINNILTPEAPAGSSLLCIADAKNMKYYIQETAGSVYKWVINGGEILLGQGTNMVTVNWTEAGVRDIYVEETTSTSTTDCFGESEKLFVEIVNDSLEIQLNSVSFETGNMVKLYFESDKLDVDKHNIQMLVDDIIVPMSGDSIYSRGDKELYPEILQLEITNLCDEKFYSNKQQTIILTGDNSNYENTISLEWNINRFWENDNIKHEIWSSENGDANWKIIAELDVITSYDFIFQEGSGYLLFRVKEINIDKNIESWSNIIKKEIDDNMIVPDVFTPNGDGFNDTWVIKNVDYNSIKKIEIFNKLGQKVYVSKNGFIPWDGMINGKILQGTYLYQITFVSGNIKYGQITILQ